MDSERYKLTVLFLKTFFRSWALSVKLETEKKASSAGTCWVIKSGPPEWMVLLNVATCCFVTRERPEDIYEEINMNTNVSSSTR